MTWLTNFTVEDGLTFLCWLAITVGLTYLIAQSISGGQAWSDSERADEADEEWPNSWIDEEPSDDRR